MSVVTGVKIRINASESPVYIAHTSNTSLTLTINEDSGFFKSSYRIFNIQMQGETSWSTRLAQGDNLKSVTVKAADLITDSEYKSGIRYCKIKASCRTAINGAITGWTDNEVVVYFTEPLTKPNITSILPKSPKITENLSVSWAAVTNADYYDIEAMKGDLTTKIVKKNIPKSASLTATVESPAVSFSGLSQSGYIWYRVIARSNDKRLTESKSDFVSVNLNLASNLRFKLGGAWIRGKPYIKVGGKWHRAVKTYVKVNGVWKNA